MLWKVDDPATYQNVPDTVKLQKKKKMTNPYARPSLKSRNTVDIYLVAQPGRGLLMKKIQRALGVYEWSHNKCAISITEL